MTDDAITKDECLEHRREIRDEFARIERQSIERWATAKLEKDKDLARIEEQSIERWKTEIEMRSKAADDLSQWNLRIEAKLDRLIWWLMVTEASVLITFAFVILGRAFDLHII